MVNHSDVLQGSFRWLAKLVRSTFSKILESYSPSGLSCDQLVKRAKVIEHASPVQMRSCGGDIWAAHFANEFCGLVKSSVMRSARPLVEKTKEVVAYDLTLNVIGSVLLTTQFSDGLDCGSYDVHVKNLGK